MKITTYIYRTIAFAGLLLAGAMPLRAQLTSYYCDFEDAQERNAWVCNAGPQGSNCANQWYIGSSGNFSENGQNGLYISADGGATSSYTTANASSVVVYREIDLQTGTYFLDFDWRALGLKNASIVVFWVPKSIPTNSSPNSGYSSRLDHQYRIGGDSVLYGAITWQSARFTFSINNSNQAGKLVFIWNCAKNGAAPNLPAACIDNISITPCTKCTGEDCEAPSFPKDNKGNVTAYDKNTATLSWIKGSGTYQVRDYNMENGQVVFYDAIQQNSVQLKTFTEGYHVFSVRSVCGKDSFSEWESVSEFIWIPGNRCVDYMDLEQATCYYGSFENPYKAVGVVDKGYDNIESRHTIHYVKGETDPRTENKLKTIPDGEIASVRLGNWENGGEAEAIEYKYTVQAGQSDIMELKYAVVLEMPGHGVNKDNVNEDPQFLLSIYDQREQQITPSTCFSANFAGSSTGGGVESWNRWKPDGNELSTDSIVWKDWTTLSISLRKYIGQTLTFRFTTKDCQPAGHYGYAYFTIGCRSGDLEGIACGDFETDHFDAPEGFNYEWRKVENDSLITDTGRPYVDGNVLHIDKSDTCIYAVEVISKMGDHCSYTLTANPNPRFPKAEVTGQKRVENCTNYADFTNASHIYFINRQNGSLSESKEPVEDVIWDFGDGYPLVHSTASTLTHEYPASGGKFTAKAIASMSNGVCQDTALIEIELPDLNAGNDTHIDKCMGESYTLPTGVEVTQDTIYTFDEKNQHGCDAASHIIVRFHKQKTDTVDAAVCEGETYDFEGETYATAGQYTARLVSAAGCDSLRTLNLTVYPKLIVDVQDTIPLCADETALLIPYNHKQGRLDSVKVHPGNIRVSTGKDSVYTFLPDEEIRIPLTADITPQDYPLTVSFLSSECPMEPVRIVARIRYAAAVIEQKNDLIALLNADYNGGFSWSGYQWYCNGTPVPGAETSYIVVGDEHLGDEYYCLLTREDGTLVSTCPITYAGGKTPIENVTDGRVYPTLVSAGENLHIVGETAITVVDVLGNQVAAFRSQEGHWTFPAPARSGLYFILNTRQIIARIIVH